MKKDVEKKDVELLGVKLPTEVKKEFEKKATELDLTMSQVARRLIEDWLKKDHQKVAI